MPNGTAPEDVTSPNFGFLAKRYPELERLAARSERYFSDDPIISLHGNLSDTEDFWRAVYIGPSIASLT